ncbi:MAG: sensor histidine kinase [Acidobacteriota bacterium]
MSVPQGRVPPAWPALVALAVVVLLSVAMLGVDLVVDRETADTTHELVGDSMRSIALADDLRYQAYRLATANLAPDQIASIAEQIDADARAYAPLATGAGENAEWGRLQALLAHLRHEQPLPTTGSSATLIAEIETSIARLVEINESDARASARQIADAHREGLLADAIVGAITVVLAALVAVALVRALRRQRELLRAHLAALDEHNRELVAFAGRAAHDLRGPLSPIKGYADLLSLESSPQVIELAARIARGVARMSGVIDDMLALSIEGKPSPGKVAIAPVVREVLDELHDQLADADVAVEVGETATACSAGVLAQILRNLVGNAAKYRSPDRRLALRVEARPTNGIVELVVADTGTGMNAEAAAHAFEPLYRAPGASSPGHGLGLSIVQRMLHAIGGSIELASKLGEGTKVLVKLPAA